MMKRSYSVALVVLGVTGVLLFVATCSFSPILQSIVQLKMRQMLALAPDSYSFHYWKTPPVPVQFQLFIFDIINPEEVMQGAPPSLLERGPYTYRVTLEKFNITFNANDTVTYRQRQVFVFDRDQSVGWDNETFTTVNAPLFTVGSLLQFESPVLQDAVDVILEAVEEKALITVSVHDIFWGYEDRFLHLAKEVLDLLHLKSDLITGTFGYYMGKNNTDDGQYTVHTGVDDLNQFVIIDTWNGLRLLDYWSTDMANMINGTSGPLYPPFVTTDRILQMYDSNLYRSVSMVYTEDSIVRNIPTMKFVVEDKEFANASINPWNAGFCTPLNHCIPSGLINCTSMGHGAPLYVSLPHFLGADPYYFRLVQGLHPDRQRHQPFFDIHQLTGVCLSAGRKYQLNLQIKEYSFLRKTHGLSLAYVPVLWINGMATIDDTIANMFQDEIETPLAIVMDFHYALFGIGPAMTFLSVIAFVMHRRRAKKQALQNGHPVVNGTAGTADERTPLLINSETGPVNQDNHNNTRQDNHNSTRQDNHNNTRQDNHYNTRQDNHNNTRQDNHNNTRQDNHNNTRQDNHNNTR